MKIVAKPIQMIAHFLENNKIVPLRFKLEDKVIKIDKVCEVRSENFAGYPIIVYRCQSIINNNNVLFEIKYDIVNYKWTLWKM